MKVIFENDDGSSSEVEMSLARLSDGDRVFISFKSPLTPDQVRGFRDQWNRTLSNIPLILLNHPEAEILIKQRA